MTIGSRRPVTRGVASAALLIATVTVMARLMGFARIIVFARTVGPSCLGDTYYTANTLPNIVFDIVAGGALSSLVVPVLAAPVADGDQHSVDRIASALLTWAGSILVPVALVGALLVHPMMRLLVGDGHAGCSAADEVAVGARMLLVFMPQIVLYGIGVILAGVLQAHRRFLGPALGPLLSSLVVAAAYTLFAAVSSRRETDLSTLTRSHELILSVGTTLGVVALVLPLLVPTARTGVRLRPTYRFPDGVAATVRRMALAGALVLGSQDIATAVVIRLTNAQGSTGAVVLYNLAWTVFLLPWAVARRTTGDQRLPGVDLELATRRRGAVRRHDGQHDPGAARRGGRCGRDDGGDGRTGVPRRGPRGARGSGTGGPVPRPGVLRAGPAGLRPDGAAVSSAVRAGRRPHARVRHRRGMGRRDRRRHRPGGGRPGGLGGGRGRDRDARSA